MITSCGFTLPLAAKPRVRISIMLITTVMSTTKVATKLRANSWRIEEWNNIAGDNGQKGTVPEPSESIAWTMN